MLPKSFAAAGYTTYQRTAKYRRLLVGTEGPSDSGKTEFALSAPGPGILLCLDRNFDATLENPNPPPTRSPDFAIKAISAPMATSATQDAFKETWAVYRDEVKKALAMPEARTVVYDGDSDSWELQRLAAFGKLTQIPAILYTEVNAARRALIARAWDSGKIVIATSKVKKRYRTKMNPVTNQPVIGNDGKDVREWDGGYIRQGFEDQDYLFHIQLQHLYQPAGVTAKGKPRPQSWGIRLTKCKPNMALVGDELWGDDCCFAGLVQYVFPDVPLSEWGY